MAQVSKVEFNRLRGGGAPVGGVLERLRIDEVPRGVLLCIALLAAVAVVLAAVLFVRTVGSGGDLLVRAEEPARGAELLEPGGAALEAGLVAEPAQEEGPADTPCFVVHVAGAVEVPGVYELETGARVFDAVEAAGGASPGADLGQINLAEPLVDGAKVSIPAFGEAASAGTSAVEAPGGGYTASGGAPLVNINTASAEELQALVGVGESTAAAIVRDREANGPFASPEDLMRVSGIGEKKFENMRDQVVV